MATVYLAQDLKHDRPVALKVLTSELAAVLGTERFLREIQTVARLNHPHILPLHDSGEANGFLYYVMPYVEGESVRDRLNREKQLPLDNALLIAREVADALSYAHSHDVVHRDIKPENILLAAGHAVVADFGIARAISAAGGEKLTATGLAIGTSAYMSPEQAVGETTLDGRSDLYSLGCVLYEMLAGEPPFTGPTVESVVHQHLTAEPPSITVIRPAVPGWVASALSRALAKTPADRSATGAQFAHELLLAQARAPSTAEALRPPNEKSIAVLPFTNLSSDPENEYFSDGITEEIIADLSNINSLAVVSRTSASRYKGTDKDIRTIAAELNVRYVLEGSVRKAGDALRITAQLIDAGNDMHLWAEKYNGTLQDVFEIQEAVARQIVEALRVKLTPAEKLTLGKRSTVDAEAFDLYLKGRHLLGAATKTDLREGLLCFEAALVRDPRYAGAHAGVAETCAAYYEYYDRNERWVDRAIESALKALVYDANLPEASAALGLAYFNKGSLEESLTCCQRAIALDPENYVGYWTLGRIYYVTGRTEEAIELLKKVVELSPDFYTGYFTLRMVCQSVGKDEIYRPYLMRLIDDVFPRYLAKYPDDARARNSYGTELTQAGRREEGLREVERALSEAPDDPLILYASACYFARFGDCKVAVDLLHRAIAAGYTNFAYIEQDPDLRPLHAEKAYQELLRNRGRAPIAPTTDTSQ